MSSQLSCRKQLRWAQHTFFFSLAGLWLLSFTTVRLTFDGIKTRKTGRPLFGRDGTNRTLLWISSVYIAEKDMHGTSLKAAEFLL